MKSIIHSLFVNNVLHILCLSLLRVVLAKYLRLDNLYSKKVYLPPSSGGSRVRYQYLLSS
jgi:hypothetical protein